MKKKYLILLILLAVFTVFSRSQIFASSKKVIVNIENTREDEHSSYVTITAKVTDDKIKNGDLELSLNNGLTLAKKDSNLLNGEMSFDIRIDREREETTSTFPFLGILVVILIACGIATFFLKTKKGLNLLFIFFLAGGLILVREESIQRVFSAEYKHSFDILEKIELAKKEYTLTGVFYYNLESDEESKEDIAKIDTEKEKSIEIKSVKGIKKAKRSDNNLIKEKNESALKKDTRISNTENTSLTYRITEDKNKATATIDEPVEKNTEVQRVSKTKDEKERLDLETDEEIEAADEEVEEVIEDKDEKTEDDNLGIVEEVKKGEQVGSSEAITTPYITPIYTEVVFEEPTPKTPEIPKKITFTDEEIALSIAKLNQDPMIKMQLSYEIEKDDFDTDLTNEDFKNVRSLNLSGTDISDYKFLSLMPELVSLDLGNNRNFDNEGLIAISSLTKLKKLVIAGTSVDDLSGISELIDLESLNISETDIVSIEPIKNLVNLKELQAYELAEDDEDAEYNFDALSYFTKMETLDITEVPLKNIDFVENMPNIRNLSIDETGISDISKLANNVELRELRIGGNEISDISSLSTLSNLTVLEANNNDINDLSPLKNLINLNTLSVKNNHIDNLDALGKLTNLKIIEADKNEISGISALKNLKNLENLRLNDNKIVGLDGVNELTSLKSIELRGNLIEDVKPLKDLSNLEIINLSNNNIFDITPLRELWISNEGRYKNINVEDQKNSMTIELNDRKDIIPLFNFKSETDIDRKGFSVDEAGNLLITGDGDVNLPINISYTLKPKSDDNEFGSTYNKKFSGILNIVFKQTP